MKHAEQIMSNRNVKSNSKLQISLNDIDNTSFVLDFSDGQVRRGTLDPASELWVVHLDSNYLNAILNFKSY